MAWQKNFSIMANLMDYLTDLTGTCCSYNKDLFDAAGVAYPSNDMTWDEYYDLAAKMTSGEGSSKVYGTHHHTSGSIGFCICNSGWKERLYFQRFLFFHETVV